MERVEFDDEREDEQDNVGSVRVVEIREIGTEVDGKGARFPGMGRGCRKGN